MTKKMTNKAFCEAVKSGIEVENAISAFAEQNGFDIEAIEKVAHAVKTLKNTDVRIQKNTISKGKGYRDILVGYDISGYFGFVRDRIRFCFRDSGECYVIYNGYMCGLE